MSQFRGVALLPGTFVLKHALPALIRDPHSLKTIFPFGIRKYFSERNPKKNIPVGMLSLRVNEACNLRCRSCGQWGENGHLRAKREAGEKLDQLDFDVVRRILHETKRDKPFYYIWGGEPTMWKPLVPLFEEMGRNRLYGSIVTNAQALAPVIEKIIDTGALSILYLSIDGWDAESQNLMRSPARGKKSNNFEKTMEIIDLVDDIKKRKNLAAPLIIPITVISNDNYNHLSEVHRLVAEKTQLHPYYFGWYITEERAEQHEKVFENRFGYAPRNHRGYLKSCFQDVDPRICAQQIRETYR
ncbi:MAG: radical SAM protein, partial [Chitinivibrionales bacterium]|nr:radical SAM protein [Chitinivibrionales bacterium]